jgi:hypothetical protein
LERAFIIVRRGDQPEFQFALNVRIKPQGVLPTVQSYYHTDSKENATRKEEEPLSGWSDGRELASITREEVIENFLSYYKRAVTDLRNKD